MKRRLNFKKLGTFILTALSLIFLLICSISYSSKMTEKARQYEPIERTIIK